MFEFHERDGYGQLYFLFHQQQSTQPYTIVLEIQYKKIPTFSSQQYFKNRGLFRLLVENDT